MAGLPVTLPALALWVGLCLSGAPAAFTFSVPEVLDDVPVGNTPSAGGRPMRLRAVRSRWDAERLRKKLTEDFLRAGLFIPPTGHLPQNLLLPYLAAIDARRMISYSVLFQVNRDGSTTLVLGEVDLQARVDVPPPAPVFPGAVEVLTSDLESMRSVGYRVKATPEEVMAFYRDVLGRAGYRDSGNGLFERGPERVQVLARPVEEDSVRVTVMAAGTGTGTSNTAGGERQEAPAPASPPP